MSTKTVDQLPPNLSPELVAVARALAQQKSLDLRQTPDAACSILIRGETEALRGMALLGLKPLLAGTERKLSQSQEALSRWELMKWDLLEGPDRAVSPCDHCAEFSPEDVAHFRSADVNDGDNPGQCGGAKPGYFVLRARRAGGWSLADAPARVPVRWLGSGELLI